jgi:hypothetical protein
MIKVREVINSGLAPEYREDEVLIAKDTEDLKGDARSA